jgi:hypothetical protein
MRNIVRATTMTIMIFLGIELLSNGNLRGRGEKFAPVHFFLQADQTEFFDN